MKKTIPIVLLASLPSVATAEQPIWKPIVECNYQEHLDSAEQYANFGDPQKMDSFLMAALEKAKKSKLDILSKVIEQQEYGYDLAIRKLMRQADDHVKFNRHDTAIGKVFQARAHALNSGVSLEIEYLAEMASLYILKAEYKAGFGDRASVEEALNSALSISPEINIDRVKIEKIVGQNECKFFALKALHFAMDGDIENMYCNLKIADELSDNFDTRYRNVELIGFRNAIPQMYKQASKLAPTEIGQAVVKMEGVKNYYLQLCEVIPENFEDRIKHLYWIYVENQISIATDHATRGSILSMNEALSRAEKYSHHYSIEYAGLVSAQADEIFRYGHRNTKKHAGVFAGGISGLK